jgi:hypothetical protein
MSPTFEAVPGTLGRALRDQGTIEVALHNAPWNVRAFEFFKAWIASKPTGYEFIAETFKREALAIAIEEPKHPNAWGAFFLRLCRAKLIINTGRSEHTVTPQAHARRSVIYVKP